MEQKQPNIAIRGVSVGSKGYSKRPQPAKHSQWPILLAIFCVLASSTGAALVVCLSDGKPTTSWKTRPSVVLAIMAPIITVSMAFLLSTAFSISWWRAAEAGTTIEHLNRIWDRAFWLRKSTWKSAVFSTNGFKRLAFVSLLVPIGNFLYNPLFQLSTTASRTGAEADIISLTLDVLPEIPNGLASLSYSGSGARMDFTAAAVQWYRGDVIHTKDETNYRCEGACRGTVKAPGIVATCTNKTASADLTKASTDDRWLFLVNQTYERTADDYMVHVLRSTYTPDTAHNCTSTVITETCIIEIGQVDYNIEITGNEVKVLPRSSSEWVSSNISRSSVEAMTSTELPGPLWALGYMYTYFGSWSGWHANTTQMSTFGILTEQLYIYTQQGNSSRCFSDYRWSSPTEYILNGMGETLFRLAMNGNSVTNMTVLSSPNGVFPQPQTFQAFHTHEVIFYKSDFKWLGIALGAVLLSLLALSSILLGSRNISRTVTLSPVETFQVFPIEVQRTLQSRSNTGFGHRTEDILKHVGDTRVQYKSNHSPLDTRVDHCGVRHDDPCAGRVVPGCSRGIVATPETTPNIYEGRDAKPSHRLCTQRCIGFETAVMLYTITALLSLVSVASATADVKTCWRNSTCDGPLATAFPGPWDDRKYAPVSRSVSPRTLLSLPSGIETGKYDPTEAEISTDSDGTVFDFSIEVGGILSFDFTLTNNVTNATIGLAFTEAKDYIGRKSDNSNGGTGQDDALLFRLNGTRSGHYLMPDVSLRGGFRYLTMFLVADSSASVMVKNISLEISFQPTWPDLRAYQGYFHSSEEVLNKAWYSGAYTLQTNSVPGNTGRANVQNSRVGWDNAAYIGPGETVLLDGAKRDRWVWIGDMGVAVPSAFVSIGDMDSTKNALRAIFDNQSVDGTLPKAGPPYLAKDSDTYHLWALIGFYNYYLYTDDEPFLQAYWSKYVLGVNRILSKVDNKGIVNVTGTADWGRWTYSTERSSASMLFYRALMTGASIATWSPNLTDAAVHQTSWTSAARSLRSSIITHLWDESRGAFKESPNNTSLYPQDANSMALAFEVLNATDPRAERVSTYLTTNWTPIGPINPEVSANVSTISPFITSIELEAHFKIGRPARSLELIRNAWGWYLNNPNGTQSTVPEGYLADGSWGYRGDRGYRNDPSYVSHAHGWSSGPTSTLTEYLVGLRVTEPKGRKWELKPATSCEIESAEAGFMTGLGKFSAKFERINGSVLVEWRAPEGTEGYVQLPGKTGMNVEGGQGSVVFTVQ